MDFAALTQAVSDAAPVIAEVLPVVTGRTVHIDADMLAYFAGGNESMTTSTSKAILLNKVSGIKDAAQAEKVVLHLTASGSSKGDRYAIAFTKPYQEKRVGSKRPANWQFLRDFMLESGHPAFTVKNWHDREADDGFGYIASVRPNDVTSTNDKDMRMLPGLRVLWVGHELVYVPPKCFDLVHEGLQYGYKWFWMQMLWGDKVDNIPGLERHPDHMRGVGEVGAAKLLGDPANNAEAYANVVKAYKEAYPGNWDRLFAEQASLLWMRRDRGAHINNWYEYLKDEVPFDQHIVAAALAQEAHVQKLKEEAIAFTQTTI